ncbi:MAG: hypothetical protein HYS12_03845 [Planctomycetes bacterium]|nr:hypothetical protein [Planctomycetota bacterium]
MPDDAGEEAAPCRPERAPAARLVVARQAAPPHHRDLPSQPGKAAAEPPIRRDDQPAGSPQRERGTRMCVGMDALPVLDGGGE